ncbi:MAG TPA: hypothetical protein VL977_05195 [Solirubrobacteraceae bacterium]|nr:hypothetical protein [Solirubrobacteraceae bacterium]
MSERAPRRRPPEPDPPRRRTRHDRALEVEDWVLRHGRSRSYSSDELAVVGRITLAMWLVAGVIVINSLWEILQTAAGSGDIPGGVLNTLLDFLAFCNLLLAIGLLMRREFARLVFLCVAALIVLEILIGAASNGSSLVDDVFSVVLEAIPLIFLTRPSVAATFR